MKNVMIATLMLLTLSCKNQQTTKAKIFERKEVDGNKLLLKYKYNKAGKTFMDSTVVENVIIPDDTIEILIDENDNSRSTVKLPE